MIKVVEFCRLTDSSKAKWKTGSAQSRFRAIFNDCSSKAVFFFRPWKMYVRRISDYILLMNIDLSLKQQNNIIKLQSPVYFQFSAEKYKVIIRYAGFKAGYNVGGKDIVFLIPASFCFNSHPTDECLECLKKGEKQPVFARCSHCENYYCFNHFYIPSNYQTYHTC